MPEADQPRESRFNQEQYDRLKTIGDIKNVTEREKAIAAWNQSRLEDRTTPIELEGANFHSACLENANLRRAYLSGANLRWAHLEGIDLSAANLEEAKLGYANLEGANLSYANLEGASLSDAHLQRSDFKKAILNNAKLRHINLKTAYLHSARLEGAKLYGSSLEGTNLRYASTNENTEIINCTFDGDTDFTGVGLDGAKIDRSIQSAWNYARRKKNWFAYYKKHPFIAPAYRFFWWHSDYGNSTGRLLAFFFSWSLLFATIYCIADAWLGYPLVKELAEPNGVTLSGPAVIVRSLYFSIVTMTTLGFGDMHAEPKPIAGHILLALQVLLGYFLLGATLARISILFTADGPTSKPKKPHSKTD